jgi:sugar phosphate isomerase/epimerase
MGANNSTGKGRRVFLKCAGLGAAIAALRPALSGLSPAGQSGGAAPFKLGLASYTFREFTRDETVAFCRRAGLSRICLKDVHLPLDMSDADIKAAAAAVRSAGLELYGCGVVYMTSEPEAHRAFQYAKTAGMMLIIGVPDHGLLDLCQALVRESGISLAIHNHGPGDKLYPTPKSVLERITGFDPRVGLCLDVGHTIRVGVDPAVAAREAGARLLEIHLKDVTEASPAGEEVEVGRGVIDIPGLLRALTDIKFAGTAAFEYEKDPKDPLPGLAESVGYVKGVRTSLLAKSLP